jgi:hypothetical protein
MIFPIAIPLVWCAAVLGTFATVHGSTTADSVETDSTGYRTVKKTLTVASKIASPNGNARQVVHVNNQFPAPDLFFDEDDHVEVSRAYNCV